MKKLLPWLKTNWLLALMGILVPAALVCGWIFSQSWRSSMVADKEKIVADKTAKLSKAKVAYQVASPVPGIAAITANQEANAKVTQFFGDQKAKFASEAAHVVELATAHNVGTAEAPRYKPLIDDMFPFPKNVDLNRQIVAFTKELVGTPGKISAYQRLLNSINAGMPPSRTKIAQDLAERLVRERDTVKGTAPNRNLTQDEVNLIVEKLTQQRIGAYQVAAGQISVYANMESLPNDSRKVLRSLPVDPPSLEQCFSWQADYWLMSDVLGAIRNANTPAGATAPVSVDRAPVKRLLRLEIPDLYVKTRSENDQFSANAQTPKNATPPAPVDGVSAIIPPRFSESATGRWGGKENKLYEVRYCHVDLIVASTRIPEILNAISASNFMTVVDLDMNEVDVWSHLQDGFYYGNDHVVQLGMEIEVVWLKSWMTPLVPQGAREQLGFALLEGAPAPVGGNREPGPGGERPPGGPKNRGRDR